MVKKIILASLAVFVAWEILDYVLHMMILSPSYAATSQLWRPMEEMKNGLMIFVVLVSAVVFVYIYAAMVANKSMATAVKYALIYGIGYGIAMGYGTYAVQPITYGIALGWFIGTVIEMTVGGVLLGLIVKE